MYIWYTRLYTAVPYISQGYCIHSLRVTTTVNCYRPEQLNQAILPIAHFLSQMNVNLKQAVIRLLQNQVDKVKYKNIVYEKLHISADLLNTIIEGETVSSYRIYERLDENCPGLLLAFINGKADILVSDGRFIKPTFAYTFLKDCIKSIIFKETHNSTIIDKRCFERICKDGQDCSAIIALWRERNQGLDWCTSLDSETEKTPQGKYGEIPGTDEGKPTDKLSSNNRPVRSATELDEVTRKIFSEESDDRKDDSQGDRKGEMKKWFRAFELKNGKYKLKFKLSKTSTDAQTVQAIFVEENSVFTLSQPFIEDMNNRNHNQDAAATASSTLGSVSAAAVEVAAEAGSSWESLNESLSSIVRVSSDMHDPFAGLKIPVFIPSYGRSIKNILTSEMFSANEGGNHYFPIYVLEKQDVPAYRSKDKSIAILELPLSAQGCGYVRQQIVAFASQQNFPWIWMVDDSVHDFRVGDAKRSLPEFLQAAQTRVWTEAAKCSVLELSAIAAVGNIKARGSVTKRVDEFKAGYPSSMLLVHVAALRRPGESSLNVNFRPLVKVAEDIVFAADCYLQGLVCLCDQYLSHGKKQFKNGGAADLQRKVGAVVEPNDSEARLQFKRIWSISDQKKDLTGVSPESILQIGRNDNTSACLCYAPGSEIVLMRRQQPEAAACPNDEFSEVGRFSSTFSTNTTLATNTLTAASTVRGSDQSLQLLGLSTQRDALLQYTVVGNRVTTEAIVTAPTNQFNACTVSVSDDNAIFFAYRSTDKVHHVDKRVGSAVHAVHTMKQHGNVVALHAVSNYLIAIHGGGYVQVYDQRHSLKPLRDTADLGYHDLIRASFHGLPPTGDIKIRTKLLLHDNDCNEDSWKLLVTYKPQAGGAAGTKRGCVVFDKNLKALTPQGMVFPSEPYISMKSKEREGFFLLSSMARGASSGYNLLPKVSYWDFNIALQERTYENIVPLWRSNTSFSFASLSSGTLLCKEGNKSIGSHTGGMSWEGCQVQYDANNSTRAVA